MNFKLDKLNMIEASCLSFSVNNKIEEDITGFSFDYDANTKVDVENNLILIQLGINVSANAESKKIEAGKFEFGFAYRVENLEETFEEIEGRRKLDQTLQMSILGISFSTARGMMLVKSSNTILQNAYLPIMNPASLLGTNTDI